MAELARGTVADRPWGRTLAALSFRGLTGQVTIHDGKQPYAIAFMQGAVVAAHSPSASDAAVRVAMTTSLISSTQVADIVRRQATMPNREEVDALAELARLSPDQAMRLRRRVMAQRAARTFGIDRAPFVVDDQITLPVIEGSELDIRTIVYFGARQFLSEARLGADLGQMGTWFQLKPEAVEDLPQFGFGEAENAVVKPLFNGANLAQLEQPGMDQRIVRAVLYALVCCNACVGETQTPARRPSGQTRVPSTAPVPAAAPAPPTRADTEAGSSSGGRADTQAEAPRGRPAPGGGRGKPAPVPSSRKIDEAQTAEVAALIEQRAKILDAGADHFALLGVPLTAQTAEIRNAYFALARQLHPDRLSALGIADEQRRAQRLFAEVNTAFSILSDPKRRKEYQDVLLRGGAQAMREEQAKAEEMAQRILEAEELFRRGEMALRRGAIPQAVQDLERAVQLNPDEGEFHAALAWARFCQAPDKNAVGPATRQALDRASKQAPTAAAPKFYLGRVERMLGREQEALRLFREVLDLEPHHAEATSEVRVLEQRLGGARRR